MLFLFCVLIDQANRILNGMVTSTLALYGVCCLWCLTFRLNVYDNLFFLPVKIMSKVYSIPMSKINIFEWHGDIYTGSVWSMLFMVHCDRAVSGQETV